MEDIPQTCFRLPAPTLSGCASSAILKHLSRCVLPRLNRRYHRAGGSAQGGGRDRPPPTETRPITTFHSELTAVRHFLSTGLTGLVQRDLGLAAFAFLRRPHCSWFWQQNLRAVGVFLQLVLVDAQTPRLHIGPETDKQWLLRERLALLRTIRLAVSLKELRIPGNASDDILVALAKNCSNLEVLNISHSRDVSDAGIFALIGIAATEKQSDTADADADAEDDNESACICQQEPIASSSGVRLKRRNSWDETLAKRNQEPIIAKIKDPSLEEYSYTYALEVKGKTILYQFLTSGCWKLKNIELEGYGVSGMYNTVTKDTVLSMLLRLPELRHVGYSNEMEHIIQYLSKIKRDYELPDMLLKLESFKGDFNNTNPVSSESLEQLELLSMLCPNIRKLEISIKSYSIQQMMRHEMTASAGFETFLCDFLKAVYENIFEFPLLNHLQIQYFVETDTFRKLLAVHGKQLTRLELDHSSHLGLATLNVIKKECSQLKVLHLYRSQKHRTDETAAIDIKKFQGKCPLNNLRQLKLVGFWEQHSWIQFLIQDCPVLELLRFELWVEAQLTDEHITTLIQEVNPLHQLKAFYAYGRLLELTERTFHFLVSQLPNLSYIGLLEDWNMEEHRIQALRREARQSNARIFIDNKIGEYETGRFKYLSEIMDDNGGVFGQHTI